MTAVALYGRDHGALGEHAVASIGSSLAVCTSAGAVLKHGAVTSRNEDAGAIARDSERALLVVADAHFGGEAAEIAVDVVLDAFGSSLPATVSGDELVALFFDVGVAVQRGTAASGSSGPSRTTLALSVVTEDGVHWAALGDSCIVVVTNEGCERVDRPRNAYLGQEFDLVEVAATLVTGWRDRAQARAIVLATDGLLAGLPGQSVGAASTIALDLRPDRGAPEQAERLVRRALAREVTDAVTVAVGLVS